jgi:hypothetical protein
MQNCTLVRSVCLSALEATWTLAPDLVESDASAETATSNVTIVNGAGPEKLQLVFCVTNWRNVRAVGT